MNPDPFLFIPITLAVLLVLAGIEAYWYFRYKQANNHKTPKP